MRYSVMNGGKRVCEDERSFVFGTDKPIKVAVRGAGY